MGKYYYDFSKANQGKRFYRSLSTLLTVNLDRDYINWVSKLAAIKLAYNSKINSSTEVKLPVNIMIPEPENRPPIYKWLSNLQETYSCILTRMYAKQDSVKRTNTRLYSNKKAQFSVGDIVWYFVKRQVVDKPPKLTQKLPALYRVSLVLNEICLELTSIPDLSIRMITRVHSVTT